MTHGHAGTATDSQLRFIAYDNDFKAAHLPSAGTVAGLEILTDYETGHFLCQCPFMRITTQ